MKKACFLLLFSLFLLSLSPAWAQAQKVFYLTFDDGPKADTPELLALLAELDVPATFFLKGASVKAFPEQTRMILEAGHRIGCHSMTHSYSYLKENVHNIGQDLQRFTRLMQQTVDPAFETDLFRFPGGSTSYSDWARRYVAEQGYAWFDWSGLTGDTHPNMNAQKVLDYALKTCGEREVIILLAHEGKQTTRDALPQIVAHYRELGYEFRMLSTSPEERAILSRCTANMRLPSEKIE